MTPLLEGIPAFFYSGLWTLQVYGKLEKSFPEKLDMVIFITDFPPAVRIKIESGEFEVIPLNDVKVPEDLEAIECDGYLASSMEILFKGAGAIMSGIKEKTVKVKNPNILLNLAKMMGGF